MINSIIPELERDMCFGALVGSHNYNLDCKNSDKDYKIFVYPTWNDLYNCTVYTKSVASMTKDYTVHDIRKLPELIFKANPNFLEILYSKEKYGVYDDHLVKRDYIEWIDTYADELCSMNIKGFVNACKGSSRSSITKLHKYCSDSGPKCGYNSKQALSAYRFLKICLDFKNNGWKNFKEVLRYDGEEREFLLKIKNGDFHESDFLRMYHDLQKEVLAIDVNSLPTLDVYLYEGFKKITELEVKRYLNERENSVR